MIQGKRSGRPDHPMRRTTSLTEFAPPDVLADVAEEEDEELQLPTHAEDEAAAAEKEKEDPYGWAVCAGSPAGSGRSDCLAAYRACAAPALQGRLRRNSADFSAAAFLGACELCNRRLGPGRDTFMYRGDTAFCSLECRQQHMTMEEWKEKCTALATTATPPQAYDPVKPASSERTDKSVSATAAAAGGGGGGMLAAARVR